MPEGISSRRISSTEQTAEHTSYYTHYSSDKSACSDLHNITYIIGGSGVRLCDLPFKSCLGGKSEKYPYFSVLAKYFCTMTA